MSEKPTFRFDGQFFRSWCEQDKASQDALYEEAWPAIRSFVLNNNGGLQDAEDFFQEGMIALLAYCKRQNFILTASTATLLYSICRYLWYKELKKRGQIKVTLTDTWEYIAVDKLMFTEEDEERAHLLYLLHRNMNRLREVEKETLRLFYFEGKSFREIAETLGFADEHSAKVQKFKFIAKLRKLMLKDPGR